MFDCVQCHSERNAAFGWDPILIIDQENVQRADRHIETLTKLFF